MNRRKVLKGMALFYVGILPGFMGACGKRKSQQKISNFSPESRRLIGGIAETILPRTDSPGALESGVDQFVIRAMNDCYTTDERQRFIEGLDELQQECFSRFGHAFEDCSPAQKLQLAESLDREASGAWSRLKAKIVGREHFFAILKRLCVIGYCTSRDGATKALLYDPLPDKWSGCLDAVTGQKGWALE